MKNQVKRPILVQPATVTKGKRPGSKQKSPKNTKKPQSADRTGRMQQTKAINLGQLRGSQYNDVKRSNQDLIPKFYWKRSEI